MAVESLLPYALMELDTQQTFRNGQMCLLRFYLLGHHYGQILLIKMESVLLW